MNWIHPDVPRRFRPFHAEWKRLTESERDRLAEAMERNGEIGNLAVFQDWRDYNRSQYSPFAGGGAAW